MNESAIQGLKEIIHLVPVKHSIRLHGSYRFASIRVGKAGCDYPYFEAISDKLHSIYHGDYEPEIKQMTAVYVHQLINELYLLLSGTNIAKMKSATKAQLAKQYIEAHADKKINMQEIADQVGVSVRYLQKMFRAEVGYSPKEYHLSVQMDKAYRSLVEYGMSVAQAAEGLGYSDPYTFSHQFKKHYGVPPQTVKNRGGRDIR
ncbi:helix-turn-helix transcriptional regulator [Paenibacillus vietnamensis]|uniref:helix-turn-helix transcriptional regulator n=1 Tax=Paenibacillus vietnamensis TaxID=2590547 RepID=UPI001CD080E6|nr:AraC family transcriptional regulator [Paenibacillus vietnamensis]